MDLPDETASKSTRSSPIKLVAIDLDGTLLDKSKRVSDRAAAALKCLSNSGVKVVIASARPPRSVRQIYQELALDTWPLNYNGALIWDEPSQQPIFHRPMHPRLVRMMIERCRDMFEEVLVSCEVLDKWFTDRDEHTYTTETGKLFKPDVICPVEEICAQPITKLMLLGDPRIISRLESLLLEEFGGKVTLLHTDNDLLQIMDNRVSKAVALQKIVAHYGVKPAEVMSIG